LDSYGLSSISIVRSTALPLKLRHIENHCGNDRPELFSESSRAGLMASMLTFDDSLDTASLRILCPACPRQGALKSGFDNFLSRRWASRNDRWAGFARATEIVVVAGRARCATGFLLFHLDFPLTGFNQL
jgi:hypothetical protein